MDLLLFLPLPAPPPPNKSSSPSSLNSAWSAARDFSVCKGAPFVLVDGDAKEELEKREEDADADDAEESSE